MSRVYFHAENRTAELMGTERHWAGKAVDNIATELLAVADNVDRLTELLPLGHSVRMAKPEQWVSTYELFFRHDDGHSPLVVYKGTDLSGFTLALNTVIEFGGDPMKFIARMHGQCEIHGWVDGPNREWLAGIIQAGLDGGVYRRGIWYEDFPSKERKWQSSGWDEVVALLRESADGYVLKPASWRCGRTTGTTTDSATDSPCWTSSRTTGESASRRRWGWRHEPAGPAARLAVAVLLRRERAPPRPARRP